MMDNELKLSDLQEEAFKKAANISACNAAKSLSKIIKKNANLVISDVSFVSLNNLKEAIAGPQKLIAGIYIQVKGDMPGSMVLIFSIDSALGLASTMQRTQVGSSRILSQEDQQTLRSIGNVVCGMYLTSLSQFLNMKMEIGDSKLISTFGESITDLIMLTTYKQAEKGLLIKTDLDVEKSDIKAEFVLLLSLKNKDQIIEKIKQRNE